MYEDRPVRKAENVKVFVRLRPLHCSEIGGNISAMDASIKVCQKDEKVFEFNKVFDQDSTQMEVYQSVASPLVDKALNGYHGTVFAYGQSGTGKTFTIIGDTADVHLRGIIPNVFSHILTEISLADCSTSYLVTVTFLEIYNEEVRDLLGGCNKKLEVRETPELGVYVKNLSGMTVQSMEQALEIIARGSDNRVLASTKLNSQSSRSHAIFTILIEAKHEDGTTTFGKLNLVDLAGSERASKSLATGDRLKEAGKINLSLSVLGNVISALVDGNTVHIPYRNSKLTRLLQDSLGGSCMTSMIATVSPSDKHLQETYYTLMYADRAKKIKNNVKKNKENESMLRNFENKIKMLQEQVAHLDTKKRASVQKKPKVNGRDVELLATENEKNELTAKISHLQNKILNGGEKALEQLQLLERSSKHLQMLDSSQQLLEEALESKQQETASFERQSLSLQEEDKLLDWQIQQIEIKIAKARNVLFKKDGEYQNEIGSLLYTNKCLAKDMGMMNYVTSQTIPERDLEEIKNNIFWDEDVQEYRLKSIAHCGNNLKKISLDVGKGPAVKAKMKKRFRKYPGE